MYLETIPKEDEESVISSYSVNEVESVEVTCVSSPQIQFTNVPNGVLSTDTYKTAVNFRTNGRGGFLDGKEITVGSIMKYIFLLLMILSGELWMFQLI